MAETATEGGRKVRGRSPSYPAIDLEAAIKKVQVLYEKEREHPTPAETIVRHWGYKSLNGPASLSLAALKKFGLIDDEGTGPDRRARVSKLAVSILRNPDTVERSRAVKEAALRPAIHQVLWDRFGADT